MCHFFVIMMKSYEKNRYRCNHAKAICLQPCNPNRYNRQFLIFATETLKLRNYELADYLMAVRVLR